MDMHHQDFTVPDRALAVGAAQGGDAKGVELRGEAVDFGRLLVPVA
jgi:hypothetical protein